MFRVTKLILSHLFLDMCINCAISFDWTSELFPLQLINKNSFAGAEIETTLNVFVLYTDYYGFNNRSRLLAGS